MNDLGIHHLIVRKVCPLENHQVAVIERKIGRVAYDAKKIEKEIQSILSLYENVEE